MKYAIAMAQTPFAGTIRRRALGARFRLHPSSRTLAAESGSINALPQPKSSRREDEDGRTFDEAQPSVSRPFGELRLRRSSGRRSSCCVLHSKQACSGFREVAILDPRSSKRGRETLPRKQSTPPLADSSRGAPPMLNNDGVSKLLAFQVRRFLRSGFDQSKLARP